MLQHAAGDQLAYAGRLTGGPGPAEDPFAPTGVLAGSPAELLEPALAAAAEAFAGVEPGTAEVAVPLPPFTLDAETAVAAAALDAAVHAWDIAVATGQVSPLTPALAAALSPAARALAEPLRGFAYAPALLPAPIRTPIRQVRCSPSWGAAPTGRRPPRDVRVAGAGPGGAGRSLPGPGRAGSPFGRTGRIGGTRCIGARTAGRDRCVASRSRIRRQE